MRKSVIALVITISAGLVAALVAAPIWGHDGVLETSAFMLVIAGQFLAAIVLISRRKTIYGDPETGASSENLAHHREEHQRVASGEWKPPSSPEMTRTAPQSG
jgi:hypothetical protein